MAISVVQRNKGGDAALATTLGVAFTGNTAASNALIAICTSQGSLATITAISDTQGKTWVPLTTIAGNSAIKGWIAYGSSAAADTITVTKGFNDASLFIFEVSGLAANNADDATNTKFANQSSVTSLSSGATGTLTFTNNLILGITVNQNNTALLPTVGAGYANLQTDSTQFNMSGSEEKVVAATTAVTATFGIAANSTSHTTAVFVFSDTDVVVLPTVTTQAASSIAKTTATANGNVTATGFATNDHQGVVYDTVTRALPGNVAPGSSGYASSLDAAGSFSAGAFTKSLTGLTKNTTYFYRAYTHNSAGYSYGSEVSFALLPSTPLIDALSDTNTSFVDGTSTKGDDKLLLESGSNLLLETGDKAIINYDYPSTDYLTYTTSTLTASTQYFWRVRQKLSGGSFGPWSNIQSFTPTSGGVSVTVTQVAATVTATGGTQVAVTNATATQVAGTVTATGGTQVVKTNATLAQVAANVTATGGTQVALTNATLAQVADNVTATGGTQVVKTNATVAQVAATVTATGGTQVLATVNIVAVTQVAATVTATGGTQAVATTAFAAVAQVAATVTATGGTQTALTKATLAQVAANVTATGGTQTIATVNNVSVTQVAGTVTAAGGTQVVSTLQSVAVTQVAANVTATGGTQVVTSSRNASATQVAATVTASGGTQVAAASRNSTVTQVAATVTASGGTQVLAAKQMVAIAQLAANVIAAGGTQVGFAFTPPDFTYTYVTLTGSTPSGTVSSPSASGSLTSSDTTDSLDSTDPTVTLTSTDNTTNL